MPPFAPSFRMDHDRCIALCAVPLYFAPAFAHPPFLSFFNVNLERGVIENRRGVIENHSFVIQIHVFMYVFIL